MSKIAYVEHVLVSRPLNTALIILNKHNFKKKNIEIHLYFPFLQDQVSHDFPKTVTFGA